VNKDSEKSLGLDVSICIINERLSARIERSIYISGFTMRPINRELFPFRSQFNGYTVRRQASVTGTFLHDTPSLEWKLGPRQDIAPE
jgi:hypothetical protein